VRDLETGKVRTSRRSVWADWAVEPVFLMCGKHHVVVDWSSVLLQVRCPVFRSPYDRRMQCAGSSMSRCSACLASCSADATARLYFSHPSAQTQLVCRHRPIRRWARRASEAIRKASWLRTRQLAQTRWYRSAQIKGTGSYSLTAAVYIPSPKPPRRQALSADLTATLGLQTPILHLDFTNDCSNSGTLGPRTVRINDTPGNCFGTFPYDQFFVLQVTLNVLPSSANASVQLVGAGGQASGSVSNIPIAFPNLAKQFGGVAFWIGYPWSGSFDVTDIIVTYRQS
jgi:hypothetical protein